MHQSNLPQEWEITTLGYIADWSSGGTPSRKKMEYYGGNIPWVKTGDLGEKYLKKVDEYISELGLKNSSTKLFPKNSVALAMYGATIGKTSILGIDATTNQACAVAIPKKGINFEFLYYFLNSQKEEFIKKGQGGAQPNISQAIIKDHIFILPSIAEQTHLATLLDDLTARVQQIQASLDKISTLLKTFRQSVLVRAMSGELTEKWREESEEEFEWEDTTLERIAKWSSGGTPSRKKTEYYNGNIPWVKTGDLGEKYLVKVDEYISELGLENSSAKLFPKNSVILAMYGATIGKTSILGIEAATNQACAVAVVNSKIGFEFLYYFLLSQRDVFISKGQGGAQPNISQQIIKAHSINLPTLPEQKEIVAQVEHYFSLADEIERQTKQAQEKVNYLTQSILAKAFRGELTANWRIANQALISGENSAKALLAKIESEVKKEKKK